MQSSPAWAEKKRNPSVCHVLNNFKVFCLKSCSKIASLNNYLQKKKAFWFELRAWLTNAPVLVETGMLFLKIINVFRCCQILWYKDCVREWIIRTSHLDYIHYCLPHCSETFKKTFTLESLEKEEQQLAGFGSFLCLDYQAEGVESYTVRVNRMSIKGLIRSRLLHPKNSQHRIITFHLIW